MESQYFEKEAKMDNPLSKALTIILIIFMCIGMIYLFFGIQNLSKDTKYIGVESKNNTIEVVGSGVVYTVPDTAVASFTAITEEQTINLALTKNREKINRVVDFLKRQGINENDIKALDFNIYPKYQWQTTGVDLSIYPNGRRVIVAYEAVESLEVIIRNSDNIGRAIQGSIDAGASQVSNLKFIISDEEAIKEEARKLAIEDSKKKASEIATLLGIRIGNASGFTEEYDVPKFLLSDGSTTGSGANMEIVVRENKIEARVNVLYDIK